MISLWRPADSLEQFTQSCGCYSVVELSADYQIRTLLALVLAEFAGESHRGVQSMALHMLIDDGKIL
jgi:hypothetical protein